MTTICVVTGTRADYGLLRWVMGGIASSNVLDLQVVATGSHFSQGHGLTYRAIEEDGFRIDRKVEMLVSSDSAVGVTKSFGLCAIGMSEAFESLHPDVVLILGDRYEALATAAAALIARVPVAHVHGGESTEGAIDEAIRHSLTKMSHLHFVAAPEYAARVVQLGEQPSRVHVVGALGLDSLVRLDLLDRLQLEALLGMPLPTNNLVVTFHPATLDKFDAARQTAELIAALESYPTVGLVVTLPNADPESEVIREMLVRFAEGRAGTSVHASLGQVGYLSALKHSSGVIGNSSSGLIEAPSLGIPTINIGSRQTGRLKAASVLDCPPDRVAIRSAIDEALSAGFAGACRDVCNPNGLPGASERVVSVLEQVSVETLLKKQFNDLPQFEPSQTA